MNSRRHTITSLSIVLLAVTIMSVSAIRSKCLCGLEAGMSLSADCSGSSCDISGTTDRADQDATMVVTASNGNIVNIGQLGTSGGSYSGALNVSNLDDGSYTIAVNQGASGKYNLSVSIEVSDGSSSSSVSVSNQVAAAEDDEVITGAASLGGLQLTAGGMEGSTTIDVSGTTDRSGDITLTVNSTKWKSNCNSISDISFR